MILQSVLQLKKRLKELLSAGYALGGRQADNTVLSLFARLLETRVSFFKTFVNNLRTDRAHFSSESNAVSCQLHWLLPDARAHGKQVLNLAQQCRRTCVVEDTHLNIPKAPPPELNPGLPRDRRKY